MNNPKFSVVTVAFNAVDYIEGTIMSVLSQDYDNVEYIIIDGGSDDGTGLIIDSYSRRIDRVVSEPDGGVYFGMNKGIDASDGDYLIFMNAGDTFHDGSVLSDVAAFISSHDDADVIYGDAEFQYEYGCYPARPEEAFTGHKMNICHQAAFVRRTLLLDHGFNVRYKYAADFDQMSSLYLEGRKFCHLDRMIARVDMKDGLLSRNFEQSADEMYDIIAARGVDAGKERESQIRREKIISKVKGFLPERVRIPVLAVIARLYKPL